MENNTVKNENTYLFDHNTEVYNELEQYLECDNKAIVVLGTGLGKTTTAIEYCARHDCRALVICPTNIIKNDWNKNSKYDTITYSGFSKKYMDIDYSKYGVVICDEIHHGGADVWGKGIKYLIDNNIIKVIGLTATNVRPDGIDVANTLFGGNICRGLTVLEGINAGILYPFSYVGAYYDASNVCEEIKEQYGDKLSEQLIGDLDKSLNNTPTLEEIIKSNMPEGDRKGIIFVERIEEIEAGINLIKTSYPDMEFRGINNKMSDDAIAKTRKWFKNTKTGYLCAINMASEGVHYNGVNTLFMLRKTRSPLVFEQQLGRIVTLTVKDNPNAIVFDFVNNSKTIQDFKLRLKEIGTNFTDDTDTDDNNINGNDEETILIDNYDSEDTEVDYNDEDEDDNENNEDLTDNIPDGELVGIGNIETDNSEDDNPDDNDNDSDNTNNPDDEDTMNIVPPSGKSKQIIFKDYTTTIDEVLQSIKDIYDVKPWSEEEDNILKEFYPIDGINVYKRLENRTKSACMNRAYFLNINKMPSWTEEEDNIIKKYYPVEGYNVYKRLKNRTKSACQNRAQKLNINKTLSWTEEEDNILREFYPVEGRNVYKRLKNRTKEACQTRTRFLNINKTLSWTEEEDNIIREFYPIEGPNIYKKLNNRTKGACKTRARFLNIKVNDNLWTEEEDNILKEFYPIEGINVYKRLENRTKWACYTRVNNLNIKFNDNSWTEEEDNILREFYPIEGANVYKRLNNRTKSACYTRAGFLNIKVNDNLKNVKLKSTKKVRCVELNKIFDSSKEASEWLGLSSGAVCLAIKRQGSCGKYHWEYVD